MLFTSTGGDGGSVDGWEHRTFGPRNRDVDSLFRENAALLSRNAIVDADRRRSVPQPLWATHVPAHSQFAGAHQTYG